MDKYEKLSREELIRLLSQRDGEDLGGIRLSYPGQRPPWQIVRQVKPRSQRIERKLCHGTEAEQCDNLLIEGENLQALVSLYKYRGQIDLVLTDPPYNTGQDFRYNDKWDENPNDPDLGELVPAEDGSRHSKWLRFMKPRLWMLKEMLRPGGVLAICIDQRELYRLGMLLDEIFGEENRLAIINWQKTTPKNDTVHVSATTEYVLVYSKNKSMSKTSSLERSFKSNVRFGNVDNDPLGEWKQDNLTARSGTVKSRYAIQSPFTGEFHHSDGRYWAYKRASIKKWLEEWGSIYEDCDIGDGRGLGLALKGWKSAKSASQKSKLVKASSEAAQYILENSPWPFLYWGHDGLQKPVRKTYKELVKSGAVPTTFWIDDDEWPIDLGTISWPAAQSGRSRDGVDELTAIVGRNHQFDTVKPMRLFRKIIQIWCPSKGIVLDAFAGSGTAGHAVLELNSETGASRRFILIEQGRPERGDPYARSLTCQRLKNALSGIRVAKDQTASISAAPLAGGFRFSKLNSEVDAAAVLALEREEMIDLLLTSHWDHGERSASHLQRLPAGSHTHLFARSARGEGFFLVWNGPDKPSILNREAFRSIAKEAQEEGLTQPFHVYARISTYSGPNIEFYQIPNRILEKLGFNEASTFYGTGEGRNIQDAEDAA